MAEDFGHSKIPRRGAGELITDRLNWRD